jgi:hypothetical protein
LLGRYRHACQHASSTTADRQPHRWLERGSKDDASPRSTDHVPSCNPITHGSLLVARLTTFPLPCQPQNRAPTVLGRPLSPPKVEWTDNSACLEAIDAMPPRGLGVLAVLDSQCKFPKARALMVEFERAAGRRVQPQRSAAGSPLDATHCRATSVACVAIVGAFVSGCHSSAPAS